jgi:pyrroloquinoline quinone (PQQ) biosynthesis protein C
MVTLVQLNSQEEYQRQQRKVRDIFGRHEPPWPTSRFPPPPDECLEPEEFLRVLSDARVECDEQIRHPFAWRLVHGKFSRAELRAWAKAHYPFLVQTLRNDALIVAKARDVDEMRKQMHVLIEEAGEDLVGGDTPSHPALWLQFGLALDLTEREIVDAPVHPLSQALIDSIMLRGLLRPIGGLPNNLRLGERARAIVIPVWRDALVERYGIEAAALRFFDAHGEADWGHGSVGQDVLVRRCATLAQQREIWEQARAALLYQFTKFDAWELAIRWHLELAGEASD